MDLKPNHPLMKIFSYQSPIRLIYGLNSIDRLKDELKKFEFKKVLLVTGQTVCKTPACDKVREVADRITEMLDTARLPQSFDELEVDESEIEPMVEDLLKNQSRFIGKNPRKPSREELIDLYESMF